MKRFVTAFAAFLVVSGSAFGDVYSGSGFAIPDNVPAGVSSVIAVAGDTTSITSVEVTLTGLTHTWIGDLRATLTSPSGTVFTLFTRVGATVPTGAGSPLDFAGTYRFTDSAAITLWGALASPGPGGVIPPGDYRTSDALSAAATSLNGAFAGQNSNGNWTLTISDNLPVDIGSLERWKLSVVPTPGSLAIFGLTGIAAGRRRR
jgi:subtilisin-like proprotein convertase family protein